VDDSSPVASLTEATSGTFDAFLARVSEGCSDLLFLVSATCRRARRRRWRYHDELRRRTARAWVEAHLSRMNAFDFMPEVKEWRRGVQTSSSATDSASVSATNISPTRSSPDRDLRCDIILRPPLELLA